MVKNHLMNTHRMQYSHDKFNNYQSKTKILFKMIIITCFPKLRDINYVRAEFPGATFAALKAKRFIVKLLD